MLIRTGSEGSGLQLSSTGHEALDDHDAAPALVQRMLREIATANRWFGGRLAVARGLELLLPRPEQGGVCTLLDIGTGAGDLPNWLMKWGVRRGVVIRPVGLERSRAAAGLAAESGLPLFLGSGERLPLRDQSVDVVLLSQVAHHFDDASVTLLMQESSRVARRGVVIAELRPNRLAGVAYGVAGRVLGFHRTTIDDGITSLARGFTRERLSRLALSAGAKELHLMTSPIARITASWRTDLG